MGSYLRVGFLLKGKTGKLCRNLNDEAKKGTSFWLHRFVTPVSQEAAAVGTWKLNATPLVSDAL